MQQQEFAAKLQAAGARLQQGDAAGAIAACDALLAAAPGHPDALHIKALSVAKTGDITQAAALFDSAARSHPQAFAILANKGNMLRGANRHDDAVAAYKAAIAKNERFPPAWAGLSLAHSQLGDLAAARDAMETAVALAPENAGFRNNLGVILSECGDFAGADNAFSAALTAAPNMISARINRGAARRRLGDLGGSIADLKAAAAAAPDLAEGWYQLGVALRVRGEGAEAEQALTKAVSLAPNRIDIHKDLAGFLWQRGASDRYLEAINEAIERTGDIALREARCELAMLSEDLDFAMAEARALITAAPARPDAYRIAGRVEKIRGEFSAAEKHLRRAVEVAPEDFPARHELAETLLAAGDAAGAFDVLRPEPPLSDLQKHVALRTTAMRLTGDESYRRYYDYDRFVRKMTIRTPAGYESLADFNAALADTIRALHKMSAQPLDQTLFGGTQSAGRLWESRDPVIVALKDALMAAAQDYVSALPDDPNHPFLAQKSPELVCAGAWSVILQSGGGHVDHVHPAGWISASYYVAVPPTVTEAKTAGHLRLGAPGVPGVDLPAEKWVRPEPGAVIFFPSYVWHGVEPFDADEPRITAPFDLAPALRSG